MKRRVGTMRARVVWRLSCLSMLSLSTLSGCAVSPLSQRAATFSTAASATVVKMQSAYQLVETTYEEAAMASLVNQFDMKGFDPASIQPFIPAADMKARTDLMSALQQYATLLAEVSGGSEVTELDKESEALGTNLEVLAKAAPLTALAKNANLESGVASAAVDALGRVLMKKATAKELPSILESAQKPIDTICTLLGQDIGTPEGTGLRNELRDKYVELIADQRTYILANEAKMSPDEKRTEIGKLPQLVTAEKQGDATLEQTQKALQQLAATNDVLTQTKKDKDAPAFRALVTQMVAQGQQLGAVYAAASAASAKKQ
jgi:hypothetical protein